MTTWAAVRTAAVPALLAGVAGTALVINDVPGTEVSRRVAGTVADWPGWAQHAVEVVSEGGLVLLALLVLVTGWRTRSRGPGAVATTLLGGLGVLLALVVSESIKVLVAQDRPCRTVPGLEAVAACPPIGDWSLPSNHATLAAALATAVVWSVPRLWPLAVSTALLVAASRVGLGVHQPHDVVDGLVLGALVGSAVIVLLHRAGVRSGTAGSRSRVLRPLLRSRGRPAP
jgi:undecaprenyl-diphosphatase